MPSHTFFGRNIGSKGGVVSYLHLEIIIPEAAAPPIPYSMQIHRSINRPTLKFESEGGQIYESAPLSDPSSHSHSGVLEPDSDVYGIIALLIPLALAYEHRS
ncbi:uncharacterized protein ARMOST_02199 [Armillaria ostoyae]|uniref:Uncharacterized protein n=1 Tax=Armillaria ostoyae TaxID=47428 RepID=A0A284QR57_ARMOS|nr:uncharacterized protein ARMOST_02199 [Armillaria ostoyae]